MKGRRRNEFVLSFCRCGDHLLILPVCFLSQRPYHTPLNTSVEISWRCLDLDRSPSTACCLSAGVVHWRFKLLLPQRLPPFLPSPETSATPPSLPGRACRFPLGSTQTFLRALPQHTRQEPPVPLLPSTPRHGTAARHSLCSCAPWTLRVLGN